MTSIYDILQTYWSFSSFRDKQEDIIHHVIQGQHALAILPTGGGKSICYQVPAIYLGGVCVVVTPLISLMKDQAASLEKKGLTCVCLYGGLSKQELNELYDEIANGSYSFVLTSPERLSTEEFKEEAKQWNITLLTIDEAHCISQWGYDFRPAYLRIIEFRKIIEHVPCIALTATATPIVQKDILTQLEILSATTFFTTFARPNISFSVFSTALKLHKTTDILSKLHASTLIYCRNRKQTQDLAETLLAQGFNASYYHAGLSTQQKNERQQSWINNEVLIMVCTNAFGMGIDKADVKLVLHYDITDSPEAFYQEAGRAGRNGYRAYHVLLYNEQDKEKLKNSSAWKYPPLDYVRDIYHDLHVYLQVPLGMGEEDYHIFQLSDFCAKLKHPILETMGAISVLEQNNYLILSDSFYKPSTIQVIGSREHLDLVEKQYKEIDELMKHLLRNYIGILHAFVKISEHEIAESIGASTDYVKQWLRVCAQHNLIDYNEQHDKPMMQLLQNRVEKQLLLLDKQRWQKLKSWHEKRALYMISIATNTNRCRLRYLSAYFDEILKEDCGICDICVLKKKKNHLHKFNEHKNNILQALQLKGEIRIDEYANKFPEKEKELFLNNIRILLDENVLLLIDSNKIKLANGKN